MEDGNIYWTHAAKQSIITRSWINVQTATKAFANGRGLTEIFTQCEGRRYFKIEKYLSQG